MVCKKCRLLEVCMANLDLLENSIPVAPLKLAALPGSMEMAKKVDSYLVQFRKELAERRNGVSFSGYSEDSFLIDCECPRFGSGEAKGKINESVRGADLYILVDVCNYSITYKVCGYENHMSPDDHYQDLKRIIAAATGKAHRINVIMPFIYEGRQHKRTKRESLDCALALQELMNMGVSNFITFDAHDPRVMNAIPLGGFDNFMPTYQFLKALLRSVPDLTIDNDHLMIISPDEGAMARAVYCAPALRRRCIPCRAQSVHSSRFPPRKGAGPSERYCPQNGCAAFCSGAPGSLSGTKY